MLNQKQWRTVLVLSKALRMEKVRAKAAENLKDSFFAGDPVDALLFAKENGLDEWVGPLVDKIVRENRNITDDEATRLGIPLVMKIVEAQEEERLRLEEEEELMAMEIEQARRAMEIDEELRAAREAQEFNKGRKIGKLHSERFLTD